MPNATSADDTKEPKTLALEPSLEVIAKAGMHFGYSRTSRHPLMNKYIFCNRGGVEVFDITKIRESLDEAKKAIAGVKESGKKALFVSTKSETDHLIERVANDLGMPCVSERWIGGALTNFKEVRRRVDDMRDLFEQKETGELKKYTKKEQVRAEEKMTKLKKLFGGIEDMEDLPGVMVVVDPKHEAIAVKEARDTGIPVIALTNSDCDPRGVDHVVPGNDASQTSVSFFLKEMASAHKGA
jgi:small subunit ribosomal protein S2